MPIHTSFIPSTSGTPRRGDAPGPRIRPGPPGRHQRPPPSEPLRAISSIPSITGIPTLRWAALPRCSPCVTTPTGPATATTVKYPAARLKRLHVQCHAGGPVQFGAPIRVPVPSAPVPLCPCCRRPMRLVALFPPPYRQGGLRRFDPESLTPLRLRETRPDNLSPGESRRLCVPRWSDRTPIGRSLDAARSC
jgi:hypothetical protein